MKVSEIVARLEKLAPKDYACSWDNPGLLCGRSDKDVSRIYVALDAELMHVDEAIDEGVDMIVTHHPLIFRSIKCINDDSPLGMKLMDLIKNDISVYSMHTNYDIAPGGMADVVCRKLGLTKLSPMEETAVKVAHSDENCDACNSGDATNVGGATNSGNACDAGSTAELGDASDSYNAGGLGFIAELPHMMTCEELAKLVKEKFGLPFAVMYDAGNPIKKIACCPGSGRGETELVVKAGADCFISGDLGHHEALDLKEEGISTIDAGHYGLEHVFIEEIAEYLRNCTDAEVIEEDISFPSAVV